jgi:hypothetical protein
MSIKICINENPIYTNPGPHNPVINIVILYIIIYVEYNNILNIILLYKFYKVYFL